jgi:hypothetical protein
MNDDFHSQLCSHHHIFESAAFAYWYMRLAPTDRFAPLLLDKHEALQKPIPRP